MKSRDEILQKIKDVLEQLFEIDQSQVEPDSNLYEDLDIDSIDAVDLVIELKKITGKRIEPDDFKSVRTVEDVVDAVIKLLQDD